MRLNDLHVDVPVPWRAADVDLQAGVPVVYWSQERQEYLREHPGGRIEAVWLTEDGEAVPIERK